MYGSGRPDDRVKQGKDGARAIMTTAGAPIGGELSPDERERIEDRWNAHPATRYLGAWVDLSDPALVRLVVDPVQPRHRGGLGTDAVNGVVMAGMFDLAIGLVAHFSALQRRVGTVQLYVQYIRPVHGNRFDVRGRLVRRSRTLVFATADLVDQERTVCAKCDGMSAIVGDTRGDPMAL